MDQRPNCKTQNHKTTEENRRKSNDFLNIWQ